MNALIKFLQDNGTKILGIAQGTVGVIAATTDIIPASQLKYWILAGALLTFWRGYGNTQAIANAVVQQHLAQIAAKQSGFNQ